MNARQHDDNERADRYRDPADRGGERERVPDPPLSPEIPTPPGRDVSIGRTRDVDDPANTDAPPSGEPAGRDVPEPPD